MIFVSISLFCIHIIPLHLTSRAAVHDGSGTLPVQAALTLAMVDSVHKTVAATLAPMRRDDVIRHLKQCAPEVCTRAVFMKNSKTRTIVIRVYLVNPLLMVFEQCITSGFRFMDQSVLRSCHSTFLLCGYLDLSHPHPAVSLSPLLPNFPGRPPTHTRIRFSRPGRRPRSCGRCTSITCRCPSPRSKPTAPPRACTTRAASRAWCCSSIWPFRWVLVRWVGEEGHWRIF
jgi:hypothetical protein